jgi:hypothetical protein
MGAENPKCRFVRIFALFLKRGQIPTKSAKWEMRSGDRFFGNFPGERAGKDIFAAFCE